MTVLLRGPRHATLPEFLSLIHSLQSSLPVVLSIFIHLSGKLTPPPPPARPNGDVVVDCSQNVVSPGIKFVKAEFSGTIINMCWLAIGRRCPSVVWTSMVRAKTFMADPTADTYYLVPVDFRPRLVPPVDDRYFGNYVAPCFARATVGDLRGQGRP
ncbi:hypothetical protein PR202_ga18172 [Eleusine coracana subsp. coracana]|uniref:Uncharacterized protein n=1 Tax=Eleusine coracana subsp. coracana TaxID=191504 RepID=A0AAV5CSH1_ELECO|nr:hypothetical protein PR202_ga18172 [Eleusine coracana subsp. coracana]